MRFKLIAILVLLFSLIAIIFLVPEHQDTSSTHSGQKISSILARDSISRIRLTGLFGSYDLNKSSGLKDHNPILSRSDWVLREPLYAPVKNERVEELVNLIFDFSGELVPQDQIQRDKFSEYGLLPPAIVLIVDFDGKKEVFSLGSVNQVTEQFFIIKEGDENLYLAQASLLKKIQSILGDIRSEQVLKFDSTKIKQLDVVRGEYFYRLKNACAFENSTQAEETNWTISADGIEMKADSALVARELKELTEIRVSRTYDNPLDILQFTGLANPILIFKVSFKAEEDEASCTIEDTTNSPSKTKKAQELFFQVGKGVSGQAASGTSKLQSTFYLKIGGESIVYEIDKGTFGDWLQSVDHFRDKSPFSRFNKSKFKKVELITPSSKCVNIVELNQVNNIEKLIKNFQALKFDMFVQKDEFKDYNPVIGTKIVFSGDAACFEGFEEIGNLEQTQEAGDKKVVAKLLKLFKCGEPELYGILSSDQVEEISISAVKACTSRS